MLQRLRESLSLILLAALPLHAMLVTVATHVLSGGSHAPLTILALWKEALLGLIVFIAILELPKTHKISRIGKGIDLLDVCILAAVVLGIVVSVHGPAKQFLFGFKYDFLPLVAFLVLRRVPWTRSFLLTAARMLVMVGGVVAAFGILTLFLPLSFFTAIGYSDLHSLYLPNAPIAAFQFLEGMSVRRIQSVMSGPNQLGIWLLLPLVANLFLLTKAFREKRSVDATLFIAAFVLIATAIVFTYSRSAWIAAFIVTLVAAVLALKNVIGAKAKMIGILSVVAGVVLIIVIGIAAAPRVLVRTQSLKGHLEKPLAAVTLMRSHPFGLGLGTAGPASNRVSDTCFFGDKEADVAWAAGRKDICLFVAGVQTSPDKPCNCPLLTENWYLQWGVEMGWLGLIVSLLIPFVILWKRNIDWPVLGYFGICVAGLFLHSFEDSAVAYSVWLLLAPGVMKKVSASTEAFFLR